jgi:hypothetical protein
MWIIGFQSDISERAHMAAQYCQVLLCQEDTKYYKTKIYSTVLASTLYTSSQLMQSVNVQIKQKAMYESAYSDIVEYKYIW